jgi:metal-dependent amidase/aminoacylase/carboxypeptidase family protein
MTPARPATHRGHGAWPESTVDPVVMAASTVLRLQTIISREIAATEPVIITIGALQAGTMGNVIPDDARLKVNVRTFDDKVRTRVLAAIERIVKAEATASGAPAPPEFTYYDHFPLTVNEPDATKHVAEAFRGYFGADRVTQLVDPLPVSEDFGTFGTDWGVPSAFWYVGGTGRHRPRALPEGASGRTGRGGCSHQPQLKVRPRALPAPVPAALADFDRYHYPPAPDVRANGD